MSAADTWSPKNIPDLTGKLAMVTGANTGLGFEITKHLALHGATVILACRNTNKAQKAADDITVLVPTAKLEVAELDLASLQSVADAAARFRQTGRPLHLLINNAGLMALDTSTTVDGFETQFGVNHLGHFALTADLLPSLAPGSRIVSMSSMGHRAGRMHFDDIMFAKRYDRWATYFQSKLANLLFTAELQRRLTTNGSTTIAVAAHPGGSNTDLGTEGTGFTNKAMSGFVPLITQSAARGAEPALRAATDPSVQPGQYYGPRWMARGHAVLETPSRRARNMSDAAKLWELSEQLTSRRLL
jgi:protochlorophyllide reductase